MIIYKATNLVNGKIYIGKTSQTIEKRQWEHCNRAKLGWKQLLYRAIRKHGEENFKWEVIDSSNDLNEIDEKEAYWIDYYNSYIGNPNHNGYNMTTGGEGTSGYKFTDEQRKARSKQLTGEGNPRYGVEITEETREKLRSRKQCGANAVEIIQLDMDGNIVAEYKSVKEASISINGDSSCIVKVCKGKQSHHKGFKWAYKG
jgi:group I intron endonuclease